MNFLCRLLLWTILCTFPAVAMAQETGQGLVCDTQKNIEDIVALANESRNFQASLEKVNNGGSACGVIPVVFIRHETVATVRTADGLRDIVRITVIGLVMQYGVQRIAPLEQFTLFKAKGEEI